MLRLSNGGNSRSAVCHAYVGLPCTVHACTAQPRYRMDMYPYTYTELSTRFKQVPSSHGYRRPKYRESGWLLLLPYKYCFETLYYGLAEISSLLSVIFAA